MENAVAMGAPRYLIIQIIASHVKLNYLQVTSFRGVELRSKWTLSIATRDCLQKNIDSRLTLHKKTHLLSVRSKLQCIESPNKLKKYQNCKH
jgi:hypothetical protein